MVSSLFTIHYSGSKCTKSGYKSFRLPVLVVYRQKSICAYVCIAVRFFLVNPKYGVLLYSISINTGTVYKYNGSHNDQQVVLNTTAIMYDNYTTTSEVACDTNILHGV